MASSRELRILLSAVAWAAAVGVCAAQGTTLRVSVDATGAQVAGASRHPSASADGRFVAFSSTATTFVAGDTNGSADVFVKDRQTGAVTRVSVRTDATQAIGDSVAPDISSDGRFVTFVSSAALVADDTNTCAGAGVAGPTCADVYVHDRTTGTTSRVSVATGGAQADNASAAPRISGNGRFVVFESAAATLVAGDTNGVTDVFLHDRQTATTTRVSLASDGTQADRAATSPTIADDGARIAFLSEATTLDPAPDPLPCAPAVLACRRAFVRSAAGETQRVRLTQVPSVLYPTPAASYRMEAAVISGDGSTVAMVVLGATPDGTMVRSIDAIATYSLLTGATGSDVPLTHYYQQFLQSWLAPSRWSSLAVSRTGRTVAACYFGLSTALNTFGVKIQDFGTKLGATAAGTRDPGGYLAAQPDCEGVGLTDDGNTTFLASSGTLIVNGDTNDAMDVFAHERDADGDGLPLEWEQTFGFNGNDPADAGLDPDGDGMTNRQEFDAATHPRGIFKYYLAEGAANAFFTTDIAVFNPTSVPPTTAVVIVHAVGENGRRSSSPVTHLFGPRMRVWSSALTPELFPDQAFSALIESDRPLAVERTLSWGRALVPPLDLGGAGIGYGSHAETATSGPATTAFFAEGATHGPFDLFYLLQNPANVPVTATITYLRPAPQAPVVRSYSLPPNSRRTIWVDQVPGLEATDVSARITADQPIFAERAMYLSAPGQPFAGGTASAGLTAPATQWFVAEGATGPFFDLYLLIGNPSSTGATVTVTYLLPDGTSIEKMHQVAAESRLTISVKGEDARLAATAVSASIASTNATPIVVERAMWWPSPGWYEGSATAATTTAATRWALAGGYVNSSEPDARTYLLVANPGPTAANVTFHLGVDGQMAHPTTPVSFACRVTRPVPARGRYTVSLEEVCLFGSLPSSLRTRYLIAGTIESDGPPIVVERSTYWSLDGQFWAAGASTLLTPVP